MALRPYGSKGLNRSQLAQFLKTPDLIRSFEEMANDVTKILPANEAEITRMSRMALSLSAQALATADDSARDDGFIFAGPGGGGGTPGNVLAADAAADTTTWVLLAQNQTGNQQPRTDANFTFNVATNTLGVDNITGTALGMTIKPKAPTVSEDAGVLRIAAQNAVKANSSGGQLDFVSGNALGAGAGGDLFISSGQSPLGRTGNFTFLVPTSAAGAGGNFLALAGGGLTTGGRLDFSAGPAAGPGAAGGGLTFSAGSGLGTGGIGGSVFITAGSSGSGGTAGDMYLSTQGNGDPADYQGTIFLGNEFIPGIQITDDAVESLIGFFGASPVVKPSAVPVTAAGIHAALVSLGLIS